MSVNQVTLDQNRNFVRLAGEEVVHTSPARTSFSLSTPRSYPGNQPVSIQIPQGHVYVSNQRLLYLPNAPVPQFQSFACPLKNLHDSHVTTPLFGPNSWRAVVQPVPGGGLPTNSAHIELLLTFKDGGAYDFHTALERIKERFLQAMSMGVDASGGAVHLEDLPTYQESSNDRLASQPLVSPMSPPSSAASHRERTDGVGATAGAEEECQQTAGIARPSDAPPGYEETQLRSVQEEVGGRLPTQTQ